MSSLFLFLWARKSFGAGLNSIKRRRRTIQWQLRLRLRARCPELFWSEVVEMAEDVILVPLHLEHAQSLSENITK